MNLYLTYDGRFIKTDDPPQVVRQIYDCKILHSAWLPEDNAEWYKLTVDLINSYVERYKNGNATNL